MSIAEFLLAHSHRAAKTPQLRLQFHAIESPWILYQNWNFTNDWPHYLPDGSQLISVKVVCCVKCSASEVEFKHG